MTPVSQFVDDLANQSGRPELYVNPYVRVSTRHNLLAYLNYFDRLPVPLLLVGEAPGYRGCAQTGIPFSSPFLLKTLPFFQQLQPSKSTCTSLKEATATIVWQIFQQLNIIPLCWNAFPFHPHQPGAPHANRRPSNDELALGRSYLQRLIDLFQPQTIGAVGRAAEIQLRTLGLPHTYLRHPSRGGKAAFTTALTHLAIRK